MRRILALAAIVGGVAAQGSQPPARAPRAFVTLAAARTRVFVHEPVTLVLRVGVDREFFARSAVPLFRRELDVPLQVVAPWLRGVPGLQALPDAAADGGVVQRIALNDDVALAEPVGEETRAGRAFTVLEVRRRLLPGRAGGFTLEAPRLRYAFATRFADDFVTGRQPLDRSEAEVRGVDLRLEVDPLPESGRPPGFTGAVGRFTVRAGAEPRGVRVGESLALEFTVAGEGNLGFFAAPSLAGLDGFHVRGVIELARPGERAFRYDLAPLREDVREVPAIPFVFFDPGPPPGYRLVRSAALPLRVGAAGGAIASAPAGIDGRPAVAGVNDLFPPRAVPAPAGAGGPPAAMPVTGMVLAVLGPWLGGLWLLWWRRARERARREPEEARARAAAEAFRARLADPAADPGEALIEYLAARLRSGAAAVLAPELPGRLERAGVPAALAARAARCLEALTALRYRGGAAGAGEGAPDRDAVRELVAALEQALARTEGAP
ncbi:MAG: BatD family protein [Planctomycetes bacterium]|nr:BatD family protein [Planctomycetota bacterium]